MASFHCTWGTKWFKRLKSIWQGFYHLMLNQDLRVNVNSCGRFFQLRIKLVESMNLISFIIMGVIFPLIAIVFRFQIMWVKLM